MKQRLLIKVEVPDKCKVGSFKTLFNHVLMVDDSLSFDFRTVLSSLKIIFPCEDVYITFKIS